MVGENLGDHGLSLVEVARDGGLVYLVRGGFGGGLRARRKRDSEHHRDSECGRSFRCRGHLSILAAFGLLSTYGRSLARLALLGFSEGSGASGFLLCFWPGWSSGPRCQFSSWYSRQELGLQGGKPKSLQFSRSLFFAQRSGELAQAQV
jgi:hypothetical protein